ncbi:MAG: response regulator [Treponemataceae bacterium]
MDKQRGRVLIVEDEDAIRLSLRDYLTRKGYSVCVASDGVGAIKILLDYEIDIVVTDYRMEVLGGDYWIRFLQRFCPSLDVIITSGFLRPEFVISYEVLFKPFDYAELEAKLAEKVRLAVAQKKNETR